MKNANRDTLDPERLKNDSIARGLVDPEDVDATRHSRLPLPSSNPATNLVITEIALRAVSIYVRNEIERRVAEASYGDKEKAQELVGGKTIVSTLALYGAGRLATKSKLGLGLVVGGLVGKVLYDRGRTIQRNRSRRP